MTLRATQRARHFVVVTGLPASGKSALARELAPLLGIELIDNDDSLDRLLDERPAVDAALRSALSRDADQEFRRHAEASDGAVRVSFWRRPELSTSSGTPTDWLFNLGRVVEVHCRSQPTNAVDRFRTRQRHRGHDDEARDRDSLVRRFNALATLGPPRRRRTCRC